MPKVIKQRAIHSFGWTAWGVDGVIRSLKYHIDLIVKTTTDPANGITCDEMTYKVMQIDLDGEIAFVVVYGG